MTSETKEPILDGKGGVAQRYRPDSPGLDEMTEADGSLRPLWRPFISMLDDLGPEEIAARWDQARRLIRENGITHNVYGDPDGLARPWNLDLFPLLLSAGEWLRVGEALSQRARLLNAMLLDVYGTGTAISSGLLPPELVHANPWFLRPVHGLVPPQQRWIHLYAADLVRSPDGQLQVLSDRTQAPSGAGYSLENRIVLNRVLPTMFRQCNALRLAPFFITLRKTLASLATANRENPRVVLLTPGPYNETYFEHAYLARYLGYTLVQGNDLTVRDCKVFLKTLSGLQRVDVILRRMDDDFCDPLELYPRSFLGVPGLLQAVREKTVAVANAIGSGVLQAAAFLPFLPGLCRHFLGEELKMESVPTWWCGQPDALAYVLQNLKKLVIKPAFTQPGSQLIFGRDQSRKALNALAAKISERPALFVAQEAVASFSAPVYLKNKIEPRKVVIRAYLAASEDSYTLMPGALTRVSATSDTLVVSLQKGGGSKDTWILGDAPVSEVSLLAPASQPVELSRGGGDLPSRVADDLFWLGRYVQRAEAVVRLARCVFNRLSDPNSVESPESMKLLMNKLVGITPRSESGTASALATALFAAADPSGLCSAIKHIHNLARVLRDRISSDAWLILRDIEQEVSGYSGEIEDEQIAGVLELLNKLTAGFLAFCGMAADSMSRGQSWRFLDLGMRLERSIHSAELIQVTLAKETREESFLLDVLLEVADSSLTYRRRYLTQLEVPAVVDLLVADEGNPRSVAYQIISIEQHLARLPRETNHPHRDPDHQLAMKLATMLRLADLSIICRPKEGRRKSLEGFIHEVTGTIGGISETVSQTYFSHAAAGRLISGIQEPL